MLPKLVVSLLVAGCFVWLLQRGGLPVVPERRTLLGLAGWSIPAYIALYSLATFLRTYRWIYLLRPIKPELCPRRVLGVGFVGLMAIVFAPLRAGEVVRPWLLARDEDVAFFQATSTVAAERIVDGLVLSVILVTGLALSQPLSPLPDHLGNLALPVRAIPHAAVVALLAFTGAFTAMTAFYLVRGPARRIVDRGLGWLSKRLAQAVSARLEHVADGLRFLFSRRHALPFLRDTAAYWLVTVVSYWALLAGCGLRPSLGQACVTMGVMGIGSLIPSGPGFFGAYQISAYCALAMYFPGPVVAGAGAAFTFVSYVIQLVTTSGFGLLGFKLMARRPRSALGEPPAPGELDFGA